MEIKSLECPKCGAPIQLPEDIGAMYTCPFCQNTVAIPVELRQHHSLKPVQSGMPDLQNLARLGEVRQLIQAGQKIEAIKIVREVTGLGLKEAKDVVEQLERGEQVVLSGVTSRQVQIRQNHGEADFAVLEQDIRALCAKGQKIEAIKMLREATDLGLKEAKDAVERVERGVRLSDALNQAGFEADRQKMAEQVSRRLSRTPVQVEPQVRDLSKASRGGISCLGCLGGLFVLFFAVLLPLAIFVLSTDNPLNSLVQRINPMASAAPLVRFGGEGTGQGFFDDPRAIAVDNQGFVYVADYSTGRIQRFDHDGNFQNLWQLPPSKNSNDVYINSLAADSSGRVFVTTGGRILVFDGNSGVAAGEIVIKNVDGDAVHVDNAGLTADQRLIAVYGGENIVVADLDGNPILHIANAISSVTKDSELDGSAAVDGLGNIFMVGSFNSSIVKYTQDGIFTNQFSGDGDEPGQLSAVQAIAVDPFGQVFVSDIHGISIFDGDGRFLKRFYPNAVAYGIAFDLQGNLWMTTNHSQVAEFQVKK